MTQSPLVWSTDAHGRVDFVGAGVLSVLGLRKADVIGRPLSVLCQANEDLDKAVEDHQMWEGTLFWATTNQRVNVCTCPVWNSDRTEVVGVRFIAPLDTLPSWKNSAPFSLTRVSAVTGGGVVAYVGGIVAASQHSLGFGLAVAISGCVALGVGVQRMWTKYNQFVETSSKAAVSGPSYARTKNLLPFLKSVEENKRSTEFERVVHKEERALPSFTTSHPYAIMDANLSILSFNDAFEKTFGQGKERLKIEGAPLHVFGLQLTTIPLLSPIEFDWEMDGRVYATTVSPVFDNEELAHVQIEWVDVTLQRKNEGNILSHLSSLHTDLSAHLPHSEIAFLDVLGKHINTLASTLLESVRECALMVEDNISPNGSHQEVVCLGGLHDIVGEKIETHLSGKGQMSVIHGVMSAQNRKLHAFVEHQSRVFSSLEQTAVRCQDIGLGLCEKNNSFHRSVGKSLADIGSLAVWNANEREVLEATENAVSQAFDLLGQVQKISQDIETISVPSACLEGAYLYNELQEKTQSILKILEGVASSVQQVSWNNIDKSFVMASLRTCMCGIEKELDTYNRLVERLGTEIVFVQKGAHVLLHDQGVQWEVQSVTQEGLEQTLTIFDGM